MLDPQVYRLLEATINTSCKLAIVFRFLEDGSLAVTSSEVATRVCRDIWSVESALAELVEDGVLQMRGNRYVYLPTPELRVQLRALQATYDHPLLRNELHTVLRDLERYAPYRHELPLRFLESRAA